jgi:hypothetical protein
MNLDELKRAMADYAEATGTETEYFIATETLAALIAVAEAAEQIAECESTSGGISKWIWDELREALATLDKDANSG